MKTTIIAAAALAALTTSAHATNLMCVFEQVRDRQTLVYHFSPFDEDSIQETVVVRGKKRLQHASDARPLWAIRVTDAGRIQLRYRPDPAYSILMSEKEQIDEDGDPRRVSVLGRRDNPIASGHCWLMKSQDPKRRDPGTSGGKPVRELDV